MASHMKPRTIRWGIMCTGRISTDFCHSVQLLPSGEHKVVGVAARQLKDAQTFANKFNIPNAYGSYEDLVKHPDVEIVYIGSLNNAHVHMCKLALNAGKHVLCEKPMTMNSREAKEVLNLAKEKGLFYMEAFWSRFFPAYVKLRECLSSESIGDPQIIQANFGIQIDVKDRMSKPELGGGGIMDIGCYTVQLAELVFGGKPERIVASGRLMDSGVDDTVSMTLHYPGKKMAVLTCTVSCKMNNKAIIYGTKGKIMIPKIWCPTQIKTPEGKFNFPLPEIEEPMVLHNGQGMVYEIKHVRERLINGDTESPVMSHSSSLTIMETLDEIRRQVGVVFPADLQSA